MGSAKSEGRLRQDKMHRRSLRACGEFSARGLAPWREVGARAAARRHWELKSENVLLSTGYKDEIMVIFLENFMKRLRFDAIAYSLFFPSPFHF